jgi:putative transposase
MAKPRKGSKAPPFDERTLDELLGGRTTAEELDELFRRMKQSLMERVLRGELTHHLGYKPGQPKPEGQRNQRNGHSARS